MRDKYKCTREQQTRLWELGVRNNSESQLYVAEEILELLPYKIGERNIIFQKNYNGYKIYYADMKNKVSPIPEKWGKSHDSLARLAADRLIWLLEEKLI